MKFESNANAMFETEPDYNILHFDKTIIILYNYYVERINQNINLF